MKKMHIVAFIALMASQASASAALKVFACEPEWGALAGKLGGASVTVYTATTAKQDPHHIEARPSLIAKVRSADLIVCTGAELEVGWLPLLLRQAGNGRVQPGSAGYFNAADHVRLREVPTRLDRSEGDIHPAGNPHIQTDPRNISRVAQALAQRLAQLDPASATLYQARYRDFSRRWSAALARWKSQAKPLKGISVVTEHKNWTYLFDWLGMHEVASLEPKPGVPPSAAYLARVLEELKQRPARMVIYAAYQDPRPALWLSKRTSMPAVELPFTVGGTPQAGDLFELFDDTLRRLLQAVP